MKEDEVKNRPMTARGPTAEKKDTDSKARPATAKPATSAASKVESAYKPLDLGDFDDPIAQAMHARV